MNNINRKNDIITALATPFGRSAVAVMRISGKGSIDLVNRYLRHEIKIGRMCVNTFYTDKFSEKLMVVGFSAPKTYTGEEIVELYPHGNMTVCDRIIKTLIDGGARLAERGEFTKRAFLNGKLDLMQCEALADIIDAQTAEQLVYGNKRYDLGFKALEEVEELIKSALSTIEAILHYSDELEDNEVDGSALNEINSAINRSIELLKNEINGFAGGKIIKDGFKIALIGAPNVGKSTLLNALTDSDRAIVTPIAGTTRDTVDGEFVYNDRKFIVIDTAGLNAGTADEVEKIGISRSVKAAEGADAVLFITAGEKSDVEPPKGINKLIRIENKCDDISDVGTDYEKEQDKEKLRISAKHGINIIALKQLLFDLCPKDHGTICNHRQYDCAVKCLDSLIAAQAENGKAESMEIVAALLYEAYSAMTELNGEKADEKVISTVFERFCVGK